MALRLPMHRTNFPAGTHNFQHPPSKYRLVIRLKFLKRCHRFEDVRHESCCQTLHSSIAYSLLPNTSQNHVLLYLPVVARHLRQTTMLVSASGLLHRHKRPGIFVSIWTKLVDQCSNSYFSVICRWHFRRNPVVFRAIGIGFGNVRSFDIDQSIIYFLTDDKNAYADR